MKERIKNKILILGAVFLAVFIFSGCSLKNTGKDASNAPEKQVIFYGQLESFSTSGEMKFAYYDIGQNKKIAGANGQFWFWAGNSGSEEENKNFIDYVSQNQDAVFKITGTQKSDDCGYKAGSCFEDIEVEKIEAVE